MRLRVDHFTGAPETWDRFVEQTPGTTPCHLWGAAHAIHEAFGHDVLRFGVWTGDGALAGILPLVRVRSRLFGHYLMSMPFLNAGGPAGTPEAVVLLAETARGLAEREGADLLELRSPAPLPIALPVSHRKITVVLDLPATAEALFQRFPAKLRSQIRRPDKEGIAVRFGMDQLEPFHAVFREHMRDLGTPALPLRFFRALAAGLAHRIWFAVAYHGSTPVAAGAGFHWQGTVEITWASALARYNRFAPNMGLYWAAIQWAIAQGAGRFDFGRCTPDSGTHRFKRQWGGSDLPLHWYQWSLSGVDRTPSPDQGLYALGVRAWKHLPLPVANWLGARLVRFLP